MLLLGRGEYTYHRAAKGRIYILYETIIRFKSFFSDELKSVVHWLPSDKIPQETLQKFIAYKNALKNPIEINRVEILKDKPEAQSD